MNGSLSPLVILRTGTIIPVIVLHNADHAVPLARALLVGGIKVLEITLRSKAALEGIRRIREAVPEMLVGAGTVLTGDDLAHVAEVGGQFAISPGLTPNLLAAARNASMPLIPGIATPSELMLAMAHGFTELKFFPAEAAGGTKMLQSLHGPFPQVTFCPTGGIAAANYRDYLALANVACVGSSWIAPTEMIEREDWDGITRRAATV